MIFRGTAQEIAALKIGDTLFNFDGNRRAYKPGLGGAPIYEKHFEAVKIVGETKNSWVMNLYQTKVNKKTLASATHYADRGYFTESAMNADIWMHDHRHKIVHEVERVSDLQILKEIARIIGYRETSSISDDRTAANATDMAR